ncbi:MAG: glycosyltransferase family 39 protein [Sedimentisphaerales bacterium]
MLCRLITLIPLYCIGKFLVGSKRSFWAILVLIMLPYPAEYGSDALRDWPHMLFLALGFLFLLWGAERGKWWIFGMVGLVAGLGCIIRPECVQLVVYGVLWLMVRLLKPKCNMSRPKLLCVLLILLIGFALPIVPYVIEAGRILPPKLEELVVSSKEGITPFVQALSENEVSVESNDRVYIILNSLGNIIKAFDRLIRRISENLMYFFVPALLIGIYYRFRKQSRPTDIERFFVTVFIILNVIVMILLYCRYGYINRRNCLPLVVCLIFYVVIGLEVLSGWLGGRNTQSRSEADRNSRRWFFILLAIGIGICLPKLFRPNRIEKKHYRAAARWLREKSGHRDLIVTFDNRITFYAEREEMRITDDIPSNTKYLVRRFRSREKMLAYEGVVKERFSLVSQQRNGNSIIAIYGAVN